MKPKQGPEQLDRYQAYLLRLWRESPQAPWRASLQSVNSGERCGFPDLQSMFAYLQTQTGEETEQVKLEAAHEKM
jgi:hypothetical protein